jgi:ribonuclease P protein component
VIIYCPHKGGIPKFGFSVSTKIGCAVVRNRLRRQLKECAVRMRPLVKTNYTYIFIPKIKEAKFSDLLDSMKNLLAGADLLIK